MPPVVLYWTYSPVSVPVNVSLQVYLECKSPLLPPYCPFVTMVQLCLGSVSRCFQDPFLLLVINSDNPVFSGWAVRLWNLQNPIDFISLPWSYVWNIHNHIKRENLSHTHILPTPRNQNLWVCASHMIIFLSCWEKTWNYQWKCHFHDAQVTWVTRYVCVKK